MYRKRLMSACVNLRFAICNLAFPPCLPSTFCRVFGARNSSGADKIKRSMIDSRSVGGTASRLSESVQRPVVRFDLPAISAATLKE